MNYYKKIKNELINNEVNKKVKDYSKNRSDLNTYYKVGKLLNDAGIDVVAHIMVGLPGENFDDLKDTVDFINMHNIQGLKVHSTYVVKNTVLLEKAVKNQLTFKNYSALPPFFLMISS